MTGIRLLCLALVWSEACAQVVHFRNGDRLSGEWVRVQDRKVIVKTNTIGEVAIPLDTIRSFEPQQRAVVSLKNGQILYGELRLNGSGEWVLTTGQKQRRLTAALFETAFPQARHEPKALRSVLSSWLRWKANANFGYSLVRGDRQAGTLSLGMNASRGQSDLAGLHDRWRTNYSANLLITSTQSSTGRITANTITSAVRQDFFFTVNNFFFAMGQLEHIEPQAIELRQTYALGVGHDLLRNPRHAISLLGGITYVNERLRTGGRRQNYSEGLLGQKLSLSLSDRVKFTHQLNFYPNLSAYGDFRMDTTSALTTRLTRRLSFNLNVVDRYLTLHPVSGRKNHLVFTSGFGLRLD